MKKLLTVCILVVIVFCSQSGALTPDETNIVAHLGIGYFIADVTPSLHFADDKTANDIVIPILMSVFVATSKELSASKFNWSDWGCIVGGSALKLAVRYKLQF